MPHERKYCQPARTSTIRCNYRLTITFSSDGILEGHGLWPLRKVNNSLYNESMRLSTRFSSASGVLLTLALVGCSDPAVTKNDPIPLPHPNAGVEVIIDDMGVAHVYAESDEDAFFGAGYAMATDRLFQMELFRRRARGTRAELLGADFVADDIGARTFNFVKLGKADESRVRSENPEHAKLIDAWTAGINRRIGELANGVVPRPYGLRESEFNFIPEPWETFEGYAIGKLLGFGMSNNLDHDILATALARIAPESLAHFSILMPAHDIFPGVDPANPPSPKPNAPLGFNLPVTPRADAALMPYHYKPIMNATGSNNWAVAGKYTANGKPFVCGDPHQALTSPSRFYAFHMNSADKGGTLDVAGFAFIGTPTVELGHNARIGWTATTNFADVMDLWDVKPDADFNTVSLGGKSVAIEKRDEVIRVRDANGAIDETTVEIATVPGYGVILPDEMLPVPRALLADGRLLFNWTGFEATKESVAYVELDRAKNIDEVHSAIDQLDVGAINLVAADQNEISYYVHARIPDRGSPAARPMPWRAITDPEDPASYWTNGNLSADKMPRRRNPTEGYLLSANTDPWGFTQDGVVENDPWYYGSFYARGFRAQRIHDSLENLISAGTPIDRNAMESMQRDIKSQLASVVIPQLKQAVDSIEIDPALSMYKGRADLVSMAAKLTSWNREMQRDAAEPVIFNALCAFAAKRAFEPAVTGALFGAIQEESPEYFLGHLSNLLSGRINDVTYFAPQGTPLLLVDALDDASAWIKKEFGSADASFKLRDVHGALFTTEYSGQWTVAPIAVNGGADTINVSPAAFFDGSAPRSSFQSTAMSLYRMVTGFADDGVPEATLNFARGNSAEPSSAHFADQDQPWSDVVYQKLAFRRSEVDAREKERHTIPPTP